MDASKAQASRAGVSRVTRMSFMASFKAAVMQMLAERKALKCIEISGKEVRDLTPKEMLGNSLYAEKIQALQAKITKTIADLKEKQVLSSPVSMIGSIRGTRAVGGLKLTISDILDGVPSFKLLSSKYGSDEDFIVASPCISVIHSETRPYFRVSLRQTNTILLYEQNSTTVSKDSDLAIEVKEDNKIYDYLTIGDGCFRPMSDAETQTKKVITFNCNFGTKHIETQDAAICYSPRSESVTSNNNISDADSQADGEKVKNHKRIPTNEAFSIAVMRIERALATNFYVNEQMRYRDLHEHPTLISDATYSYKVNELFRFVQPVFETYNKKDIKVRKAVSDISFCFGNADLIAVGYGIFCYVSQVQTKTGNVCVWSIKNPQNPERTYEYKAAVTAVSFSPYAHSLLAVGTAKGWVEVRDITSQYKPPLAIINRSVIYNYEPVIAIKWYMANKSVYENYHMFLTFSLSTIVQKFRFLRGPYLYGMELTRLDRVISKTEGLPIISDSPSMGYMVHRRPIGLNLTLDMINDDLFYLLTDQGCLHKCSMRFMNTYETTFRMHHGAVNCMEFSPWSPKIFLTCGNDWYVRIWMFGILEPLVALTYKMAPINHAAWSPTHSTIILSLNRDTLDIWDLRCNLFKPKQSIYLEKGFNTLFKFSPSGSTILIGKEMGDLIICALDEMPPPSHFQYDILMKVLYDAIEKESVRHLFKETGFCGYYKQRNRKYFSKLYARI